MESARKPPTTERNNHNTEGTCSSWTTRAPPRKRDRNSGRPDPGRPMSEILQLRHFGKPPFSSGHSSPWRGKLTSGVAAPGGLTAHGATSQKVLPPLPARYPEAHPLEGRPALACSSCHGLTDASLAPSTAQQDAGVTARQTRLPVKCVTLPAGHSTVVCLSVAGVILIGFTYRLVRPARGHSQVIRRPSGSAGADWEHRRCRRWDRRCLQDQRQGEDTRRVRRLITKAESRRARSLNSRRNGRHRRGNERPATRGGPGG